MASDQPNADGGVCSYTKRQTHQAHNEVSSYLRRTIDLSAPLKCQTTSLHVRSSTTEYKLNNRQTRQTLTVRSKLAQSNASHVTTTEYDKAGHATVRRSWGIGASEAALAIRQFYDASGRVTAIIDGSRSNDGMSPLTTYTYDALGNMTQSIAWATGVANDITGV